MKPIDELLRNLARPEVLEFGLVTNRLPSVNIGGRFEPVDDDAPTTETLLQILRSAGGGRHVEALSDTPVQWTTRVDGVGVVVVAAILRRDVVQARFTVARRAGGSRPSGAPPAKPAAAPVPAQAPCPPGLGDEVASDDEPTLQTISPSLPAPAPLRPRPPSSVTAAPRRVHTPMQVEPAEVERVRREPRDPALSRPAPARGSLDDLLALAAASGASDLHLVGGRPPLLRVAGELHARDPGLPADVVDRIARDAVPAELRERLASRGACDFALTHPQHGRLRVRASRRHAGTCLAIRVLPREVPTAASLGLPGAICALASAPRGLVLVAGAPGHGKTTTLAALVDIVNASHVGRVVVVEDPVEIVHPQKRAVLTQHEVGRDAPSMAAAAEAALGQDVDVLVLGDIDGLATLRVALDAAESGCLVLASVACAGADRAVGRLLARAPASELPILTARLARAVHGITGQRLVPSPDGTRRHVAFELVMGPLGLHAPIGADHPGHPRAVLGRAPSSSGIRMVDSLAELVRAGKVTLEVARTFADSPRELDTAARTSHVSGET